MVRSGRLVRSGIAAGIVVLVVLVAPAYALHPGNPVGVVLTVLAFSPVAFLVAGGVAARSPAAEGDRGARSGARSGAVTGAVLGLPPAAGVGYILQGVAALGGGFSTFGRVLSLVIVLLVPVVAGVIGGVGGAATAVARRRVAAT